MLEKTFSFCLASSLAFPFVLNAQEPESKPEEAAAEEQPADATAWLGVATAPVGEALAAQLDLPEGTGATVQIVVPDSPAAAAGIKKNDILFEFDGELIRSPKHLTKLVQARKPGRKAEIATIQRGKRKELEVEFGARPAHLNVDNAEQLPGGGMNFDDLGGIEFDIMPMNGDLGDLQEQVEKMRKQVEKQFQGMLDLDDMAENLQLPNIQFGGNSSSSVMMSDGDGSLKIETRDGKKTVTAKDPDGNLVFEGPANTDEELEKIPAKVREKLDRVQINEGRGIELKDFKLDFGRPKMKVPKLKPGKKVQPAPPAAEKDGKKIEI